MYFQNKMKIFIASCCMILIGLSVHAVDSTNIQNTSKSATFELSHSVTRKSMFSTRVLNSLISEANTVIGKFKVQNNTSDGFIVSISSTNSGYLKPASTQDGETDIAYTISIDRQGDIGEGVDFVGSIETAALASNAEVKILNTTATQTTPTDLTCEIEVVLASDQFFEMAGSYSDTLTVTYEDK